MEFEVGDRVIKRNCSIFATVVEKYGTEKVHYSLLFDNALQSLGNYVADELTLISRVKDASKDLLDWMNN